MTIFHHSRIPFLCFISFFCFFFFFFFFFQAEDGIRDADVTGVQTCALPISSRAPASSRRSDSVSLLAVSSMSHRERKSRSEERRVGKECRSRWWPYHEKKKKNKKEETGEIKRNIYNTIE